MMAVGVIAAMIATYRKNKEKAQEFWSDVASGILLKEGAPALKLRETLLKAYRSFPSDQYRYCAAWWESYRTGIERKSANVYAMSKIPEINA
jgi:hypothetical protein